jgi:hypothetical protein
MLAVASCRYLSILPKAKEIISVPIFKACPHALHLIHKLPTYLPQLHLYGGIELHEPSVEVELLCLRLLDAHICSLCRKFADILQVLAQFVAQLSKLCLAVVLQTEGKCLQHAKWSRLIEKFPLILELQKTHMLVLSVCYRQSSSLPDSSQPVVVVAMSDSSRELTRHSPTHHASNVMIEGLDVRVGAQQLQTLAVRLPQKLHPWRENSAVTAVLGILSTHGTAT